MSETAYAFTSRLWLYVGDAGWHFVTLPTDVADAIDEEAGERAGFGSIPVLVTVGATTWATSLFPDKKASSFVLPVKKSVRVAEGLEADDPVGVRIQIDPSRRTASTPSGDVDGGLDR